jgi:hypothetical protein
MDIYQGIKKARRVGLAQQRKHEEMLDLQYDK